MSIADMALTAAVTDLLQEARQERDQARTECADLRKALLEEQLLGIELAEALGVVTDFAATTIEKLGLRDTNGIIDAARAALAKAEAL